jgi:hypothetical protein
MKLVVEKAEDWQTIAAIGGPVVDPMILRCGELFLRGASEARDSGGAWDLLSKNIHALGAFFDRIILDEKIPVFNYADTFDLDQNFDERALSRVNADEEVLVDVDVRWLAYQTVKAAAESELIRLYSSGVAGIKAQEAANILGELTQSGYAWYPRIDAINLPDGDEKRIAAYILGGLIFGAYAQLAGANHFMQPKRSRLFLALSLNQETGRSAEEYLFAKLGELTGRPIADIPYTPTFFPLLLAQSNGPAELLKNALKMRKSAEVADYRAWLRETMDDFSRNGRISIARTREVEKIQSAVQRKLAGMPLPQVDLKMTLADVAALKPPIPGIDLTQPAKAGWGWFIDQLPGYRHRKLLTRAIVADREFVEINLRVSTVWHGRS